MQISAKKLCLTWLICTYRYYVKKCARPQKRAALALAVSIGSAVETDDEQGVAHIVEHLAFNATEVSVLDTTCLLHAPGQNGTLQSLCIHACFAQLLLVEAVKWDATQPCFCRSMPTMT